MLSYRGYYAGARYGAFSLGAEHSMTPITGPRSDRSKH